MQAKNQSENVRAMRGVLDWAMAKDFKGHDPHDLLEAPVLKPILVSNYSFLRLFVVQLGRRSPLDLHTLLRVPERENPKALALFISGLVRAQVRASDDWLRIAEGLAERLMQNGRSSWGYPFAWQSRTHFVPRDAPTIVATVFVAQSLIDLYEVNGDPRLLERARMSVEWILSSVPRTSFSDDFAFGYGPDDPQVVFNASLLGAALLARVGATTHEPTLVELAKSAARFVMKQQASDGSWLYGLEPTQTWIDGFHTGFVLGSLLEIAKLTEDNSFANSANRGFDYYVQSLLTEQGLPKYFNDSLYPIDAHAAAQAIITLSLFGEQARAETVAQVSMRYLRSPSKYFYYQVHKAYTNRVPYLRWSNAWMFRALSELSAKEPEQ